MTSIKQSKSGDEATESSITENGMLAVESEVKPVEYQELITRLEAEKLELLAKLKVYESAGRGGENADVSSETVVAESSPKAELSAELVDELKVKLDLAQQAITNLKEQIVQLNAKLNEMNTLYESTKQSELEEKNKIKHLERSVRALKIEKDQLFTVSSPCFLFPFIYWPSDDHRLTRY